MAFTYPPLEKGTRTRMMHSFPKIFTLGQKYCDDIFKDEVEITEKIDGSQFRWCLSPEGEVETYSRGALIIREMADKLFKPAVEHVWSIKDKLIPGWTYFAETLHAPRHNCIRYTNIPTNHLALFGVGCDLNTTFLPYEELQEVSRNLEIDVAPLIYKGCGEVNLDKLYEFLDRESYLGGHNIEGFVIKNLHRKSQIAGYISPILIAKCVNEEFKEKHSSDKQWETKTDKIDKIEYLFGHYRSEARWNKAIQHLAEKGELEFSPRDIGKLMKECNADIILECREEIMDALWKLYNHNQRIWTRGLAEYYKDYLMKRQFTEQNAPREEQCPPISS